MADGTMFSFTGWVGGFPRKVGSPLDACLVAEVYFVAKKWMSDSVSVWGAEWVTLGWSMKVLCSTTGFLCDLLVTRHSSWEGGGG